jgi:hypothetical protein
MATASRVRTNREAQRDAPTYVYGVGWASAHAPPTDGVAECGVEVMRHGKLGALVSTVPRASIRARRRDLIRHADVLQAAFDKDTVVPLRFGTVFERGDDVVEQLLEPRHDELVAILRRLSGLVELTVRAFYVEDAVLAEIVRENEEIARLRQEPGLQLRLGEAVAGALAAHRERDAERILSALVPRARDTVVEERQADYEVLRAAFLVERRAVSTFDAKVSAVAADREGVVRFKYTGPLPPHHFVDARWES